MPLLLYVALLLTPTFASADSFGDYWYQGKAEITSYELSQARYGEIHQGQAVLIFVTEDFSASKHVKLDRPERSPDNAVKVLKMNATRKFSTGIYPYSMMSSVFTPVYADRHPKTLKVTTSSQEWCGHTYTQLNLENGGYRAKLLSYFEREGDRERFWADTMLEDELWNRIRLNPEGLPTGDVDLIPGTIYQRFRHTAWGVHRAIITMEPHPTDVESHVCRVTYTDLSRTLTITYRKSFPHQIDAWTETQTSGSGENAVELTTTATLDKRIKSDYWRLHGNADAHLRKEFGLE